MKKAFRILILATLVLVGAVMAGCNPDEPKPQANGGKMIVEVAVKLDKGLDGNQKYFTKGDQIAFVYTDIFGMEQVSLCSPYSEKRDARINMFSWEVMDPDETKDFTLVYPASRYGDNGIYGTLDIQDGTLESIIEQETVTYTGPWKNHADPNKVILGSATLAYPLAICKFTVLDKDSNDITNTITNLRLGDGIDGYVINRKAEPGPIYVMTKPVENKSFLYFSKIGNDFYSKTVSGQTFKAGGIYPISLTIEKVEELGTLLPGVFTAGYRMVSVSSLRDRDRGKSDKVRYTTSRFECRFSRGNLQFTDFKTWSFAKHQWDYIGTNGGNSSIGHTAETVDLFGWSSYAMLNNFGVCTSIIDNEFQYRNYYSGRKMHVWAESPFRDWGENKIVDGGDRNWFTLDPNGWRELLVSRYASTVNGVADARFAKGNVNGVRGLILFPDVYIHPAGVKAPEGINDEESDIGLQQNDYQGDDWKMMEFAGAVFLPAAGWRDSHNNICDAGVTGHYWTSMCDPKKDLVSLTNRLVPIDPEHIISANLPVKLLGAESVIFSSSDIERSHLSYRYEGSSVRLVNEVDNRKIPQMTHPGDFGYEDFVFPDDIRRD